MSDNRIVEGKCWIAYFDMLGFKSSVNEYAEYPGIYNKNFYDRILEEIDREVEYVPERLDATWFSDSFIFYTSEDSYESFVHLNMAAEHFMQSSSVHLPLRGALSFGYFYADKVRGIYIGEALIDAYKYAEKQDWIGFVLTPQTVECLLKNERLSRFLAHESEYKKYPVPVKVTEDILVELSNEELYGTCPIGSWRLKKAMATPA